MAALAVYCHALKIIRLTEEDREAETNKLLFAQHGKVFVSLRWSEDLRSTSRATHASSAGTWAREHIYHFHVLACAFS